LSSRATVTFLVRAAARRPNRPAITDVGFNNRLERVHGARECFLFVAAERVGLRKIGKLDTDRVVCRRG
jgi:hypothetical protein